MGQRCPRCSAPIEGDYKFCPACAFRLKPGAPEPLPPAPPRAVWKARFLLALAIAAALGCALLGVVLFQPAWFRVAPTAPPKDSPETRLSDAPPLTVDDILTHMSHLAEGDAYRVPYDYVDANGLVTSLDITVFVDRPMNAMKYEVTRGQYAEYLRDVEAHRDRIPSTLVRVDDVPREKVDLWLHVPPSWIVRDDAGEPVRWAVDERTLNVAVSEVSFYDARAFAEWASARFHRTLVIPLASQWVRAARAANLENEWPWGSDTLTYACNNAEIWGPYVHGRPYPVQYVYPEGRGGATAEDLFAMAGNVREWADSEGEGYDLVKGVLGNPSYVRPRGRRDASVTTVWACGGSFKSGIDDCKVESKTSQNATDRYDDIGFRLFEILEPGR